MGIKEGSKLLGNFGIDLDLKYFDISILQICQKYKHEKGLRYALLV